MAYLKQYLKSLLAIIGLCMTVTNAAAEVRGICTRLEGQKLLCGAGGGGPRCTASSCSQYAAGYYTCDSFQLCTGESCSGSKTEDPCPPANSYSMCDTPPTRHCTTCPQGTAPPNVACSGTCYSPNYMQKSYKYLSSGGQYCKTPGTKEVCTITEAGKDCHNVDICLEYGTNPDICTSSSVSCISSYSSTPNVPVGCSCLCGPTGMADPGPPPACNVPADTCT